jgi:hypothetical protein
MLKGSFGWMFENSEVKCSIEINLPILSFSFNFALQIKFNDRIVCDGKEFGDGNEITNDIENWKRNRWEMGGIRS